MPVKSYIAHAATGHLSSLTQRIAALPGCTVLPSENRSALVIITDTPSEKADQQLHAELERLDLAALTLVAAFTADDDLISLGDQAA